MSLLVKPPRTIPNSVLGEIFTILAAARDKHARQAQAVPMLRDAVECIKALSTLVCVSQRYKQLAMPLLYQTIVFSRDAQHRLFFPTLRQNRPLGRLVKNVTFFELRDYSIRENQAFPSLIDERRWDNAPTDPLADDVQRLWGALSLPERRELNDNVPEIRDAVLELFTIIKHLPNLMFLRYVGRASPTMFSAVLYRILCMIPRWLALPMVKSLVEMEISGRTCVTWFEKIFGVFRPPMLRSLSITYTGKPPPDKALIKLQDSFSTISTIRELRLSLPHFTSDCVMPVLFEIDDLEVLHLDLFNITEKTRHENIWFAIRSRCDKLRDLRIRFKDRYWTKVQAPHADLIPWPITVFHALAALDLPDALLFGMQLGNERDSWVTALPPSIQVLTVSAWFMKGDIPQRLKELFQDAWRVPKLRTVVVRERLGLLPLIKAELRRVVERYTHRNIAYSHEWF